MTIKPPATYASTVLYTVAEEFIRGAEAALEFSSTTRADDETILADAIVNEIQRQRRKSQELIR